jgi:hypothetical protein
MTGSVRQRFDDPRRLRADEPLGRIEPALVDRFVQYAPDGGDAHPHRLGDPLAGIAGNEEVENGVLPHKVFYTDFAQVGQDRRLRGGASHRARRRPNVCLKRPFPVGPLVRRPPGLRSSKERGDLGLVVLRVVEPSVDKALHNGDNHRSRDAEH